LGLQVTNLADVGEMLKQARSDAGLSQKDLAERAGVARTTLARMETLARGDMSVAVLVRLLEAAGYDLRVVKRGHARTLDDVLKEQKQSGA
jgi:transcriptional regulator with XRE-family HTH domain